MYSFNITKNELKHDKTNELIIIMHVIVLFGYVNTRGK